MSSCRCRIGNGDRIDEAKEAADRVEDNTER
jgi:hypothetical protein